MTFVFSSYTPQEPLTLKPVDFTKRGLMLFPLPTGPEFQKPNRLLREISENGFVKLAITCDSEGLASVILAYNIHPGHGGDHMVLAQRASREVNFADPATEDIIRAAFAPEVTDTGWLLRDDQDPRQLAADWLDRLCERILKNTAPKKGPAVKEVDAPPSNLLWLANEMEAKMGETLCAGTLPDGPVRYACRVAIGQYTYSALLGDVHGLTDARVVLLLTPGKGAVAEFYLDDHRLIHVSSSWGIEGYTHSRVGYTPESVDVTVIDAFPDNYFRDATDARGLIERLSMFGIDLRQIREQAFRNHSNGEDDKFVLTVTELMLCYNEMVRELERSLEKCISYYR